MKFYIVDAFTDTLFGGNPAGVVILGNADFPEAEVMRKTAAELRYSETAFIKQTGEKEFNIRYFTPAAEVDLCGHATIGAFFALADAGLVNFGASYINNTLAGRLNIVLTDGAVLMDMAVPQANRQDHGKGSDLRALRRHGHQRGKTGGGPYRRKSWNAADPGDDLHRSARHHAARSE